MVARYNHSPRRRVVTARYRSSPRGQKVDAAHNARRIFIGANYHSTAQTIEDAAVINSHVKEKLREFKQRFADGKEIESVHAGEVPTEAAV